MNGTGASTPTTCLDSCHQQLLYGRAKECTQSAEGSSRSPARKQDSSSICGTVIAISLRFIGCLWSMPGASESSFLRTVELRMRSRWTRVREPGLITPRIASRMTLLVRLARSCNGRRLHLILTNLYVTLCIICTAFSGGTIDS